MIRSFPIYDSDNRQAGEAHIQKEGLYYAITCQCKYSGQRIPRIYGVWEGKRRNLGVCVPKDGSFERFVKIPVKDFPAYDASYFLRSEKWEEDFTPLTENGEFPRLPEIESAKLTLREQEPGILLPMGSDDD